MQFEATGAIFASRSSGEHLCSIHLRDSPYHRAFESSIQSKHLLCKGSNPLQRSKHSKHKQMRKQPQYPRLPDTTYGHLPVQISVANLPPSHLIMQSCLLYTASLPNAGADQTLVPHPYPHTTPLFRRRRLLDHTRKIIRWHRELRVFSLHESAPSCHSIHPSIHPPPSQPLTTNYKPLFTRKREKIKKEMTTYLPMSLHVILIITSNPTFRLQHVSKKPTHRLHKPARITRNAQQTEQASKQARKEGKSQQDSASAHKVRTQVYFSPLSLFSVEFPPFFAAAAFFCCASI